MLASIKLKKSFNVYNNARQLFDLQGRVYIFLEPPNADLWNGIKPNKKIREGKLINLPTSFFLYIRLSFCEAYHHLFRNAKANFFSPIEEI
jgi:hypothetical protein